MFLRQWIIESAAVKDHAWSGARWVPIDRRGLPAGKYQVCNFHTALDAAEYCRKFGFTVVETVVGVDPLDVAE